MLTMPQSRAMRRHHAKRIEQRTHRQRQQRSCAHRGFPRSREWDPQHTDGPATGAQPHRELCACWMCGNPRRVGKGKLSLTRQERVADLDARSQLATVDA